LQGVFAADQGTVRRTLPSLRDDGEAFMCLEGAGGRPVNGFGDEGAQARGPEQPGTGDVDGSTPGLTLGCPGCAEAGYCRRGPDPEELPADCVARGTQAATW
jgi:hypothetical protein